MISSGISPRTACFRICLVNRPRSFSDDGNGLDELYKLVIEKRHTRFNRVRHAHAINFRQNVARQVGLAVEIKQPLDTFRRARNGRTTA